LLVTCTLVAADVALSASPLITPVTLVKLKLKLSALAETGARHVTATTANDVSAKSLDFMAVTPLDEPPQSPPAWLVQSSLVNYLRVSSLGKMSQARKALRLRVNEYAA
jgi:hypothetical protein